MSLQSGCGKSTGPCAPRTEAAAAGPVAKAKSGTQDWIRTRIPHAKKHDAKDPNSQCQNAKPPPASGSPFWTFLLIALVAGAVGWMTSMAFFRWQQGPGFVSPLSCSHASFLNVEGAKLPLPSKNLLCSCVSCLRVARAVAIRRLQHKIPWH